MKYLTSTKLWLSMIFMIGVLIAFAWHQSKQIGAKQITPSEQLLLVNNGSSVNTLSRQLEKQGIIKNALHLKLLAKQQGNAHKLKAGEYDISQAMSLNELWQKLVKGEVLNYKVRFVEGWDFKTLRAYLAEVPNIKHLTKDLSHKQIMQKLGAKRLHPEGQFAPNTFFYQKGASDLSILKQSFILQKQVVDNEWKKVKKSNKKHIKTAYQALILASIIEKETGKASERREISGVFHNRLEVGMKLQTDPTVIYGMGDTYKGNIKRIHLRTDTPYNTYTRYGLPPTPIAMPGNAAIHAALNPLTTKAFYFVGKGDGSHYFSKNLAEHNRAVAKYQLGQ